MNIIRPTLPSYVPNFLYKYTSVERALEILQTGQVYFSHRQELNDPFDCRCMMDSSTREKREDAIKLVNQKLKEHEKKGHDLSSMLSEMSREEYHNQFIKDEEFANNMMQKIAKNMDIYNIGVYCFAEQKDSIIMWAHYANNHQGCCLEFNLQGHVSQSVEKGKTCFPFWLIKMVKYSAEYPISIFGKEDDYPEENYSHMFKSKDWQYEKEWRAIMYDVKRLKSDKSTGGEIPNESRMKGSGHYPLDKDLLHGIILGCEMEDCEKKSIIDAALSCGIRIYQAQPNLYKYGMKIKPSNIVVAPKQMLL